MIAQRPELPAADPAPLGLGAFGVTTLVFGVLAAGIVDDPGGIVLAGVALAAGGAAQLLAGMWAFRNRDPFAATAFTAYGAFWLSYWALVHDSGGIVEGGGALGIYLVAWGVFAAIVWIASFGVSVVANVVYLLVAVMLLVLGIGEWAGSATTVHAGGYVGLAAAAAMLYAALATFVEASWGRPLLPTWPLRTEEAG